MRVPALLAVLVAATTVSAEPIATGVETESQPMREPVTAAPVEEPAWSAAPSPRDASGVARDDARPLMDRLRWIPRSLLFLPRMAVWVIAQPFRGAAYAYERYDVPSKATDVTFNDARTLGFYPTVSYETGFGITLGGRLIYRDIFGAEERVKLRIDFGGRFRQAYGVNLRSGERFGKRVSLELDSSYERRPQERFYGIGNRDLLAAARPTPIDPTVSDAAIATRFRETIVRNVFTVDARLAEHVHARTSGALMLREFSGSEDADSITMRYETAKLVGFEAGVENLYLEQALVYDSRRPGKYHSQAFDATGWLATVHAGVTRGIRRDPSRFYTYGGELQRYFDLYDGSRVLVLRVLAEAIGGTDGRRDGRISFIDLPRLGGSEYLRGYPNGRFRDRAVALGSAEYNWDLGNFLAAFTFVDVGRPLAGLDEIANDKLRVGFGGGVQVHSDSSFLTRLQLAGSRDGDVFVEVALSPAFGRRERAGRY